MNKSNGQPDGVSKTLPGERQNAAYDLGLLFAKACVSNYLDYIRVPVYVSGNCRINVKY